MSVVSSQWLGKAPNPKFQTPNKSQTPKFRTVYQRRSSEFGVWELELLWCFELGSWSFHSYLNASVIGRKAKHRTSKVEHVGVPAFDVRRWMLDVGCSFYS